MANEVFVDTSGFYAMLVRGDDRHAVAKRILREGRRRKRGFVTTDYILDETVTLLLARHSHAAGADFLQTVTKSKALHLEWVDSERFHAAAEFFTRHRDKEWSFTDCVSFAVMRELRVRDAFTTDHHFKQAGFIPLLKR